MHILKLPSFNRLIIFNIIAVSKPTTKSACPPPRPSNPPPRPVAPPSPLPPRLEHDFDSDQDKKADNIDLLNISQPKPETIAKNLPKEPSFDLLGGFESSNIAPPPPDVIGMYIYNSQL